MLVAHFSRDSEDAQAPNLYKGMPSDVKTKMVWLQVQHKISRLNVVLMHCEPNLPFIVINMKKKKD